MDGACWGSVKGNGDSLINCCFDLGKDRCLFCEWVASLEGCNVMHSSCKDAFFWLLNGGVKCWAIMFWIDVMWVLRVCFFPSTKFWSVKYSSLVCVPLVVFPEEFYPKIIVFYFDKFNNSMCFLWEVDVVSSVFVSKSVVFKVCVTFDVFWGIVLLSPVDSLVLIKSSDEYYCCQGVTSICPVFQGCLRKAWLVLRSKNLKAQCAQKYGRQQSIVARGY